MSQELQHSRLYRIGLVTQSLLYVAGGVNHLWHTQMYQAIMPTHYTHTRALVQVSGLAEILGGIGLLVPSARRFSAWGIIAMLVVYFDVHLYMLTNADRFATIPRWALQLRIPIQFLLIDWAYAYTRRYGETKEQKLNRQ